MSQIILRTFWVWHKRWDGPDCELALGDEMVAENFEEWERMKKERLDTYGDDVQSCKEIALRIDYDAILRFWSPDPIDVEVQS